MQIEEQTKTRRQILASPAERARDMNTPQWLKCIICQSFLLIMGCHGLQSTVSDLELGSIWKWSEQTDAEGHYNNFLPDICSFSLFQVGWSRRHIISIISIISIEFEFDSVSECECNVGVLVHVCTDTTPYLCVSSDPEGINSKIGLTWNGKINFWLWIWILCSYMHQCSHSIQ